MLKITKKIQNYNKGQNQDFKTDIKTYTAKKPLLPKLNHIDGVTRINSSLY